MESIAVFVLFSPLWWLLIATGSGLIIWALEKEKGFLATVVLTATVLTMVLFGNMEFLTWMLANPGTLAIGAGIWIVAGVFWGLLRWFFYNRHILDEYEEDKMDWLHDKGIDGLTVPDNLKVEWQKFLLRFGSRWCKDVNGQKQIIIKPRYWERENRNRIVTWMALWPWSISWYVLQHAVKDFFKRIQRYLSKFMEGITNLVFRNIHNDYEFTVPESKSVENES